MSYWTATLTITLTLTLTLILTLKKEKGKCFELNLCLDHILKWTIMCESRVGVSVKTVTVLSRKIFSCADDRLAQKSLRMWNHRTM